jgi:hypothetical protein
MTEVLEFWLKSHYKSRRFYGFDCNSTYISMHLRLFQISLKFKVILDLRIEPNLYNQ